MRSLVFQSLGKAYSSRYNYLDLTFFHTRTIDDPEIQSIAKDLQVDPAQLLISWAVQRGTVVLPKSVTPSRIESNFKGR